LSEAAGKDYVFESEIDVLRVWRRVQISAGRRAGPE
jgi:hypothetical protein